MSTSLLVAWLVVALLVLVAPVVVYRWAAARPTPPRLPDAGIRWRQVLLLRLASLLVGIGVAVLLWAHDSGVGRGRMLALTALGLCVLVGTAVGESVVRPPVSGVPRRASTTPRRIRDYLPASTPWAAGSLATLVALLVATTLSAGTDRRGRARVLSCHTPSSVGTHSPYAGAYYSGPLALGLLVVLAVAGLAARQVVDRPRGLAAEPDDDDLLRRNSLDVVVAAAGVAIAAPLTGVLLTTGSALLSLSSAQPSCPPGWWPAAGWTLLLLALGAGVLTLAFLARLLGPARVRRGLHHRVPA